MQNPRMKQHLEMMEKGQYFEIFFNIKTTWNKINLSSTLCNKEKGKE